MRAICKDGVEGALGAGAMRLSGGGLRGEHVRARALAWTGETAQGVAVGVEGADWGGGGLFVFGLVCWGAGHLYWCEHWQLGARLIWWVRGGRVIRVLFVARVLWLWGRWVGERLSSIFRIIVSRALVLAIWRSLWVIVAAW